jgi:hypothetical protein
LGFIRLRRLTCSFGNWHLCSRLVSIVWWEGNAMRRLVLGPIHVIVPVPRAGRSRLSSASSPAAHQIDEQAPEPINGRRHHDVEPRQESAPASPNAQEHCGRAEPNHLRHPLLGIA